MKNKLFILIISLLLASCDQLNFYNEYTIKNRSSHTVTISPGYSNETWKDFTIEPGLSKTVKSKFEPFTFFYSPSSEVYSKQGNAFNSNDFYIYDRVEVY